MQALRTIAQTIAHTTGFSGLSESGRIGTRIVAEIPKGPITPGEYLTVVDGPMGGHAVHATVTDEVIASSSRKEGS